MSKNILNREAFLAANAAPAPELVEVPEIGGSVFVRCLTAKERDAWEIHATQRRQNVRAAMVARCVCDEKGERLFSDNDVDALGDFPAAAIMRIYAVAERLNRVTKQDIEELEGNS